jgi:hypothetical protein
MPAIAVLLVGLLLMPATMFAAEPSADPANDNAYYAPLTQETGASGLKLMLRKLQTTGRLMQVTAHPDDEDGGMLTLESRGKGVSTLLMTLTRGEGGQNKLGSNLFDVLGVLRTLELLASDRYYGVEQRFSHVADFGYSKTPEETFQKWQGHEVALGDLVAEEGHLGLDHLVVDGVRRRLHEGPGAFVMPNPWAKRTATSS